MFKIRQKSNNIQNSEILYSEMLKFRAHNLEFKIRQMKFRFHQIKFKTRQLNVEDAQSSISV